MSRAQREKKLARGAAAEKDNRFAARLLKAAQVHDLGEVADMERGRSHVEADIAGRSAGVEVVTMLVHLLVPQQIRAAIDLYQLATAQARMVIVQGPT